MSLSPYELAYDDELVAANARADKLYKSCVYLYDGDGATSISGGGGVGAAASARVPPWWAESADEVEIDGKDEEALQMILDVSSTASTSTVATDGTGNSAGGEDGRSQREQYERDVLAELHGRLSGVPAADLALAVCSVAKEDVTLVSRLHRAVDDALGRSATSSSPRQPFASRVTVPPRMQLSSNYRDWNGEFQQLWRKTRAADTLSSYERLSDLARDFQEASELFAKVIISERHLPISAKSIQPAKTLGFSGGEKFVVNGILFKYALDVQLPAAGGGGDRAQGTRWLFGGAAPRDDLSMKLAGSELRANTEVFQANIQGINVPLMCLVDYLGFRLVASALLPITSNSTLRYGSADGAYTVHNSDPDLRFKIRL